MVDDGVARELIAYGRELDAAGSAQVGDSFTSDAAADRLIRTSPNAFLLGVLFTQGIPAERAWAGPARLLERLGSLEPSFLATHPELVCEAVQRPPMLHRFKRTLPAWIVEAARKLDEQYGGDASNIWPEGTHVLTVTERLDEFPGIGRKKAVMAVGILTRHFGVRLAGEECGQVAFDIHVRRVFLRSGLVNVDSREAIEEAAARICPQSPGTLDLPAWLIGRQTCRPVAPQCDLCRLSAVCPRLTTLRPAGVGERRT